MLSIGSGAPRISPSENIHLKSESGLGNVPYRQGALGRAKSESYPTRPSLRGCLRGALGHGLELKNTRKISVQGQRKPSFNVETFLATVDGGRTISKYRKNQIVFSQGDPADSVFYIQEGKVKVCVVSEQGKEAVVALHGNGDFFGEGCLTGQPLRLATVVAMTECVIMRLDKAAIVRVLHDEPKFAEMFLSYILARNARVEADLVDQLFNSSEKRLARALLLMANFGKEGAPQPVITKISQETLAEMIGTTRSRVSTFMNKFRKLGFIEYNGELEVHNSLLNVVLHDNPRLRGKED
jgi:CRP/FNR family transcriptional regulator, cyclic AMP receptor protein